MQIVFVFRTPKNKCFFWEIFQILYLNFGCGVLKKKGVKSETNFISIIPNISIKQQARCYASCWERWYDFSAKKDKTRKKIISQFLRS